MGRTAILISCREEEAAKIRTGAAYDFRGVSAYVLNIVMRAVALDEKLLGQFLRLSPFPASIRTPGRRTAVLIRCSDEQASRIRAAAKRRATTISSFVLICLSRNWDVGFRNFAL